MTRLQDEINVFSQKEPINPITEHLKQSSFQPDIQSYVILDAKIHQNGNYWLQLHAKYFDSELEIFLHPHHGQLDEAMKYLKNLNQLTEDMMEFIKRNT